MTTAWARLPNARHIDGILADAKARPEAWDRIFIVVWATVRVTAQTAAWDEVGAVARDSARDAGWSVAEGHPHAVRDTILALLAWPDSTRMLTMTPAALRTLIDITEGDVKHQAVLILPAVAAGYVPTEGD